MHIYPVGERVVADYLDALARVEARVILLHEFREPRAARRLGATLGIS